MNKHELIEAIRRHNRSASVPFLMAFEATELSDYLQRLGLTQVRRGSEPAVTVRDCLARRASAA
jgi:hypothetical protein